MAQIKLDESAMHRQRSDDVESVLAKIHWSAREVGVLASHFDREHEAGHDIPWLVLHKDRAVA